jgi:hypothetical protein
MTNQCGGFAGVPFSGFGNGFNGFNNGYNNGFTTPGFGAVPAGYGWNAAFAWNPAVNGPAFNGYNGFTNGFNGTPWNGFNNANTFNGFTGTASPFGQPSNGFDWNAFVAGCGYGCTNAFAWFNAQQGQQSVNQGNAQYAGSYNGFNPGTVFGYGFPFGPFPFQTRQQQAA